MVHTLNRTVANAAVGIVIIAASATGIHFFFIDTHTPFTLSFAACDVIIQKECGKIIKEMWEIVKNDKYKSTYYVAIFSQTLSSHFLGENYLNLLLILS
jgi:hypothetical protein